MAYHFFPPIMPPVIIENPTPPLGDFFVLAYHGEGSLKTLIFIIENIGRVLA